MPDVALNDRLNLVRPDEDAPLVMNRRAAPRRRVNAHVTGLLGRPMLHPSQPRKICSLRLADMSDTGLGGASDEALPVGGRISVFFPPHGSERGFDMAGRVVRCEPSGDTYRVGIELGHRAAA
jgi:hypothetical protein